MTIQNIDVRRVSALPATLVENTLYFVKADGESLVQIFVTNNDGTIAATQVAQRHRGTYSAGGSYVFGDLTLDQGSTFVNILASTGVAPPTLPTESNANWQLVAKAGAAAMTGAEIKAAYEAEDDTNAFTDDLASAVAANTAVLRSVDIDPIVPITGSGTALGNLSARYDHRHLSNSDQWIFGLETGAMAAGQLQLIIARVDGANLTDGEVVATLSFPSGANDQVLAKGYLLPAGYVPGIIPLAGAQLVYTAGVIPASGTQWYTAALPSSPTAYVAASNNGVQFGFSVRGEVTHKALETYDRFDVLADVVGATQLVGWPDLVTTGSDTPANYSVVVAAPVLKSGWVTAHVGADGVGTSTISIVEMTGNTLSDIVATTTVTLANAVTTYNTGLFVEAGQYLAIAGGGYKFQASNNPEGIAGWQKNGVMSVGDVLSLASNHGFEVRFEINSGHIGDIYRLQNGQNNDGLTVLAAADGTGVADATDEFAAARANHPQPYVSPGTFAVTAMAQAGRGLWGPGEVRLSGNTFFIPRQPSIGTLHEALRQRFAELIGTGAPLIYWGDSITQAFTADTGAKHFTTRLAKYGNIFNSPNDEPVLVNLTDVAGRGPAFYGVTFTGTTAGGTRGPRGSSEGGSIVMSSGSALSFTGPYAEIGLTYAREPSAGTLTVKRNGSTLATINADGVLELDRYSGAIATGNAASATYTVECSVADVEITSVMRWGAEANADVGRLRTIRWARGSFTFGSYGTDEITSILKISSALSASPPSVLCLLGVNDAASISTVSGMKAAADTKIDLLQAGGVTDIIGCLPMRPNPATHASRHVNMREVLAGLRQSYREQGAQIISIPVDMVAAGLFGDGIHPTTDEGQIVIAQSIIEGVTA